jgi:hypothetical protein
LREVEAPAAAERVSGSALRARAPLEAQESLEARVLAAAQVAPKHRAVLVALVLPA